MTETNVKRPSLTMLAVVVSVLISGLSVYYYVLRDNADRRSPKGNLNISWFVFRDVNRNGTYDTGDRPYSGLRVDLERPYGKTITGHSNISGFANFKMSTDPRKGVITEEGIYRLSAKPPSNWEITSGAEVVDMHFVTLEYSPAGIVAEDTPEPLGVAPVPSISGQVEAGAHTVFATDPSGEEFEVETDQEGRFQIKGSTGTWLFAGGSSPVDIQKRKIDLQYYPVVLSRSFLASPDGPPKGREVTIGYDDLTTSKRVYKIPSGYKGLNWKDWISTHSLLYGGSGYVNAAISSDYVAYKARLKSNFDVYRRY